MEMGLILREQLESLHAISIEIASLRELSEVQDRALGYCLELTSSEFGFVGLLDDTRSQLDVAAIKGFLPSDPRFYERFRLIPVRPSVFGVVITEERSNISNDVAGDPAHIGQPHGHPPVRTFLGVPLRVGTTVIGMLGVANRYGGYAADDERLLSTFANQVAVAIDNARLYQRQREMIDGLENLAPPARRGGPGADARPGASSHRRRAARSHRAGHLHHRPAGALAARGRRPARRGRSAARRLPPCEQDGRGGA